MKKTIQIILFIIGVGALSFNIAARKGLILKNYGRTQINLTKEDVIWDFGIKEYSDGFNPQLVEVIVQINDKKYNAGSYSGNCLMVQNTLIINEVSGITCSWSGTKTELGIFIEDEKIVLKKRKILNSTNKNDKFVGEFETILKIEDF